MIVTVQFSTVLSPATLKILPLNGTSIEETVDAGSCAALQRKLKVSCSSPAALPQLAPASVAAAGKAGK